VATYLTRKEAAALLGLSTRTLSQWAWKGTGPPFRRIQGNVRYPREELEAWIETQPWGVGRGVRKGEE
jgi:excisionase family DNA binding protein